MKNKREVEDEEAFASHKKEENSATALKSMLGITSDAEQITRTTSYQPPNDQKLLS